MVFGKLVLSKVFTFLNPLLVGAIAVGSEVGGFQAGFQGGIKCRYCTTTEYLKAVPAGREKGMKSSEQFINIPH